MMGQITAAVANKLMVLVAVDNKHFQYVKNDGIEMLKLAKYCRAKGLNFENSLTDYVYIINESDLDIEIHGKDGKVIVPIETMAIFHFNIMQDIVVRRINIEEVPLDKSEFVRIITGLGNPANWLIR